MTMITKIYKYIFALIASVVLPSVAVAEDGVLKFKNQNLVGVGVGFGPSFDCEGGATDYSLECWNVTFNLNYSENGTYTDIAPNGVGVNPSTYVYSFGYDIPIYNKGRLQLGLNPTFGWCVKNYFSDVHHTKMCPYLRVCDGFRFGVNANADIAFLDKMCGRVFARYTSRTLVFGFGVVVRR